MAESSIEWTDYTFNPWMGCAKVHTGCTKCYAEKAQPVVMRAGGAVQWGEVWQGGERVVVSDSTWKKPMQWARDAARTGERRRVFCASLADVLEVPEMPPPGQVSGVAARVLTVRESLSRARGRLWDVIRDTSRWWACSGHSANGPIYRHPTGSGTCVSCGAGTTLRGGLDWLLLTKRPENAELVPPDVRQSVWLGTSISDQKTADEWVPRLIDAQGFRLRFLSVEPLVGPVDLSRWMPWVFRNGVAPNPDGTPFSLPAEGGTRGIEWVIVGGESGQKARPCNVEWVRDIVRQCREAGVPCFVKQLGAFPADPAEPPGYIPKTLRRIRLTDAKGGDMAEWSEDLRVRQLPGVVA